MIFDRLYSAYAGYAIPELNKLIFRHSDLLKVLNSIEKKGCFNIACEGVSIEQRKIFRLTWGKGPFRVLLWSQMHGNEATATRALCDFFVFLSDNTGPLQDIRNTLYENFTLEFLPMLNPDGAEVWQRENAIGIDINRDALSLTCPESKILNHLKETLHPNLGFNLHDQSPYYSAGISELPATLTLLAPPTEDKDNITPNRLVSMRVVNTIRSIAGKQIGKRIARWRSDFEPRAFGEQFQISGIPVVLIEAGGYPEDRDRNMVRQLIFSLIPATLIKMLSDNETDAESIINSYENIPINREGGMFDKIERNVKIQKEGLDFITDIGYRYMETIDKNGAFSRELVRDTTGDLNGFGSYG